ncbi:DUF4058 family protein [Oscillatoria sp. CS-180]|uniref:DUF4058 family protein n=1 Tax=Oscillatoria sp. CS-180 TaxID=3021720 RepID=UPI00232F1873|nr:DUF4058 family protein [Oscillatoria sp. CS-180]MDB9526357.1 DUF4058 family protein [Oscillatoria sp. CS-180]
MKNPFPGMNPYLEQPGLWPQVHNRLIIAIADEITPQVAPQYRVSIEERIYASTESASLIGIADVAALSRKQLTNPSTQSTVQLVEPRRVTLPMLTEVKERFLQVRLLSTDKVVCVVELLSPANKRAGAGRIAYETKRQAILSSATNLVEVDLLRGGDPLPISPSAQGSYSILVSRSADRPEAELYEFELSTPIPCFPIPLDSNDLEPIVPLQELLNTTYTRARFDLAIDYSQAVKPELSEKEMAWIEGLDDFARNTNVQ